MEAEFLDVTSLLPWAEPIIAFGNANSAFAVAGLFVVLLLAVILAGSVLGLIEGVLLIAVTLLAIQQGEQVLAAAFLCVTTVLVMANLRRRRSDQLNREIRWEVGQLHARVDDFLNAVDRRSKQLDLAIAASTAERERSNKAPAEEQV